MSKRSKKAQAATETLEIAMISVNPVTGEIPFETLPVESTVLEPPPAEIILDAQELAQLDVSLAPEVEEAPAGWEVAETTTEDQVDFEQIMTSIDTDASKRVMEEMNAQIDARRDLEIEKNTYNDNIQRTLKKVRATMVRHFAARVLIATNASPTFITEQSREGEHYNVYAMGKLNDLVDGLCGLPLKNAINIAIVRSMFKLRDAGIALHRKTLECAASDKIRVTDPQIASALVRHTVGATTAPTQTSSTMRALETLGIVKSSGPKNATVFELLDTPQTRQLEQIALSMAA